MSRRIEIELTSSRDDGVWTWRAAGAKQPRGELKGDLVPEGSTVGDVLRVDAEFFVDGIEIIGVLPTKGSRAEPERLELLAKPSDAPAVTTTLSSAPRDARTGGRRRTEDPKRRRSEVSKRPKRESSPKRSEPPPMPAVERPKAKRLRAGRAHRKALLDSLPDEQRPIAEQVVLGGLPAVRQAIVKQNAERVAAGEAEIAAGPLVDLAEKLVPKVRSAEWRDRAEAAERDLAVVDLRDLRSVVSAATAEARDPETQAIANRLREALAERTNSEHSAWLAELTATLDVGRTVRALRLSSRPPKAGAPLPPELSQRLSEGAAGSLTSDAPPERWVAVLEALALSPVRDKVIPQSLPSTLHPDVRATIARLAGRIPKIAEIFEISHDRDAPRPKRVRRPQKVARAKPPPAESQPDGGEAPPPEDTLPR